MKFIIQFTVIILLLYVVVSVIVGTYSVIRNHRVRKALREQATLERRNNPEQ